MERRRRGGGEERRGLSAEEDRVEEDGVEGRWMGE